MNNIEIPTDYGYSKINFVNPANQPTDPIKDVCIIVYNPSIENKTIDIFVPQDGSCWRWYYYNNTIKKFAFTRAVMTGIPENQYMMFRSELLRSVITKGFIEVLYETFNIPRIKSPIQ